MSDEFLAQLSRREILRGALAAGVGVSAASLLAACGGGETTASPVKLGVAPAGTAAPIANATFAFPAPADNLDFIRSSTQPAIVSNANAGLLALDTDGTLTPNLAESWEQPDLLTYRYRLRPGLKFSDGSPLTADDVAFTMNTVADPATGSQYGFVWSDVKTVEAVGDHEVVIHMKTPNSLFANIPAHAAGWVTSRRQLERYGAKIGSGSVLPVGAGAYRVVSFKPSESVTFERNPHYWGPKPPLERFTLRFIPDAADRLLALRSGEVDLTLQVPIEDTTAWQGSGISLVAVPGAQLAQVYFNVERPPFDDIHVRRAMVHAYNAAAVAKNVLHGMADAPVHNGFVPPLFWVNLGMEQAEVEQLYASLLPAIDYNLDAARSELAKSKVPNGFSASIRYQQDQGRMGKAILVWQEALRQIGITLNVKEAQPAAIMHDFLNHDGQFVAGEGWGDYPDPFDIYYINFHSKFAVPNAVNCSNFKNPEADKAINAYLATTSDQRAKRLALAKQAAQIIQDQVPACMLYWPKEVAAVGKRVTIEGFSAWYLFQPWAAHVRARAT
ncbi:MAG: ABC transporter substrate-binding protein [Conexibacter sp.]